MIFDSFRRHCGLSLLFLAGLLALQYVLGFGLESGSTADAIAHFIAILTIATCGLLLYRLTFVLKDYLLTRFDIAAEDNLRARQVHTQFRIFQRVVLVVAVLLAVSGIFMTFERLESLGKGLFASAGIAGLILGLSAQKTIGAFIAGIQLAITQPIRLDDVVIVEGEWGRIEEITLSYVVVRIWDLRRLVVPVSHFLEQPFQNWTRTSAEILGTVFLTVDYTVPVEEVRKELEAICRGQAAGLWDGKTCGLQVTEAGDKGMILRALVSAQDASKCWDLRCLVRERLLEYLQREHPEGLPQTRLLLRQEPEKDSKNSGKA
ncbi:MAG: mechanosensitive ion channel family protein [Proteobacteria bacterium]|nr:mechanosensitive ion channel family protein [Pseudomonadota bacterium]